MIEIGNHDLHARAGARAVVDDMFRPLDFVVLVAEVFVPVDTERFALAGVASVVGHEALASDEIHLAVAIQIDHRDGVRLGPGVIDDVLLPGVIGHLLHPEQAVVVRETSNQVGAAIAVHVKDVDEAGLIEIEFGVEGPIGGARVSGGFEPAFGSNDVVTAVFVDVADADAVAVALRADDVFDEGAVFGFIPREGVGGCSTSELGEYFAGFAVVIEIDEEGELDVVAGIDQVLFPFAPVFAGILVPPEFFREPGAADDIDIAVVVDVKREV